MRATRASLAVAAAEVEIIADAPALVAGWGLLALWSAGFGLLAVRTHPGRHAQDGRAAALVVRTGSVGTVQFFTGCARRAAGRPCCSERPACTAPPQRLGRRRFGERSQTEAGPGDRRRANSRCCGTCRLVSCRQPADGSTSSSSTQLRVEGPPIKSTRDYNSSPTSCRSARRPRRTRRTVDTSPQLEVRLGVL